MYFYPRSPCGERREKAALAMASYTFLSTLSLRRATVTVRLYNDSSTDFYPRSPCGERPISFIIAWGGPTISIHALLAESDCNRPGSALTQKYFYPRSPCGERRGHETTPYRVGISIHALLAESDYTCIIAKGKET